MTRPASAYVASYRRHAVLVVRWALTQGIAFWSCWLSEHMFKFVVLKVSMCERCRKVLIRCCPWLTVEAEMICYCEEHRLKIEPNISNWDGVVILSKSSCVCVCIKSKLCLSIKFVWLSIMDNRVVDRVREGHVRLKGVDHSEKKGFAVPIM